MNRLACILLLVGTACAQGRIDHIIVIFNENRSLDHFFATFQNTVPGANGFGAMPVGQCSATAPQNPLSGCYAETDCGGSPGSTSYCSRGPSLEFPAFQAKTSKGNIVSVLHNPAGGADKNCGHEYAVAVRDVDQGKMDRFDTGCAPDRGQKVSGAFAYYNGSDFCNFAGGVITGGLCSAPTLWNYASQGTLMDHFFASSIGPSYPNHLYMWSGQSNGAADNATGPSPNAWNCDNQLTASSPQPNATTAGWYRNTMGSVNMNTDAYFQGGQCTTGPNLNAACRCTTTGTNFTCIDSADCGTGGKCTIASSSSATTGCVGGSQGCVCPDITTVADQADSAGVTWHFYAPLSGTNGFQWNTASYIQHIYFGADWATDVSPAGKTSSDVSYFNSAVSNCTTAPTCSSLSQLVWVVTGEPENGHPLAGGDTDDAEQNRRRAGNSSSTNVVSENQNWTVSVVQSIMNNPNVYEHAVIFIVWDDFGGFFDHVATFSGTTRIDDLGWGPRVAAICVGPFCQNGVSHTAYEFSSILRCMENPPNPNLGPFTLTSVDGNGTYSGTVTGGDNNAFAGAQFSITGFANPGNNLAKAVVTASTANSLSFAATTTPENDTGNAQTVAPWNLPSLGTRDVDSRVNNVCTAPVGFSNGEWSTGGVINLSQATSSISHAK